MSTLTNNKKEKFLFAIDLDGTLLSSSRENIVPENCIKAIQRAKDEGHVVCIFTGRPWRSTKPIYDMLGLIQLFLTIMVHKFIIQKMIILFLTLNI